MIRLTDTEIEDLQFRELQFRKAGDGSGAAAISNLIIIELLARIITQRPPQEKYEQE